MQSLLVVGCGDIGQCILKLLNGKVRVVALTSTPQKVPLLRSLGAIPVLGNLDNEKSLQRLKGLCSHVIYLAPPAQEIAVTGENHCSHTYADDLRCKHLCQVLLKGQRLPKRFVYISTTGVYSCGGGGEEEKQGWISETTLAAPATLRGKKRLCAEQHVRNLGTVAGCYVSILRVPGIYALDRAGGNPAERLKQGLHVLDANDDVYTQHIHADDLARACVAALFRANPQRGGECC